MVTESVTGEVTVTPWTTTLLEATAVAAGVAAGEAEGEVELLLVLLVLALAVTVVRELLVVVEVDPETTPPVEVWLAPARV